MQRPVSQRTYSELRCQTAYAGCDNNYERSRAHAFLSVCTVIAPRREGLRKSPGVTVSVEELVAKLLRTMASFLVILDQHNQLRGGHRHRVCDCDAI